MPAGTVVSYVGAKGLTNGSVAKQDGEDKFIIPLGKAAKKGDDGAIEYSSSSPEIAGVHKTTGEVTLTGAKAKKTADYTVTITATKEATTKFKESKATYKIVVQPGVKLSFADPDIEKSVASDAADTQTLDVSTLLNKTIEAKHTAGPTTYSLHKVLSYDGTDVTSNASEKNKIVTLVGTTLTFKGVKGTVEVKVTKPKGMVSGGIFAKSEAILTIKIVA